MLQRDEFGKVWDRYADRLMSFFRAKVASREEAEDLLQELFLRAHAGLCCLVAWENLDRWLYRVARNLVIDRYRARREHEPYEDSVESHHPGPEPAADPAAELAFSLRDMVDRLPEPYRRVLVLAEYEGMAQADIAARLGLSLPAVKSRVRRARAMLKARLLECCHFELDRLGGIVDYEERCASCDRDRASNRR